MTHAYPAKTRPFTDIVPALVSRKPPRRSWPPGARRLFVLAVLLLPRPCLTEDWLAWGGPHGDFTVDAPGLAEKWPADGPRQLWKRPLGEGYSSILFRGGRLYTAYSEGDEEVVVSLDAQTGKTMWEHRYKQSFWPDMTQQFGPGPNATPLIVRDRIVSIGIDGQLRCLDLASGSLLWKHDLPAEFGRIKREEEYGYSNSPLLYKNTIIVQVGGDRHGVVAFDPDNGSAVWKSEPGGVSYAAPTLTTLAGQEHFIYFAPEGVIGLDPSTGRSLWRVPIPADGQDHNGNHLTPVVKCDENHVWVASQFLSGGAQLLEITRQNNQFNAKQVWFKSKLRASHWTSICIGDFIYGSTGGNGTSFLTAFNWKTGQIAWRKRGYHKAQSLYADGKFLLLDEGGKLTIGRITPEGFEALDTAQVTESVSWTLPTLVSTKLYVRDRKHILALDLAKTQGTVIAE